MFLLNLTWVQLFMAVGGLSAGVVALYLWDRSKRRVRVATLRFWQPSERVAEVKHRKRIQQPLSLLLQLLSIALLVAALAQPRLGAPGPVARDNVLLLDTSAWMAARSGDGTLMDEARDAARAYVRALPAGDRVMLVRADALATPATPFEHNRAAVLEAIDDSHASSTALNLTQALDFARQAQRLQGGLRGEIAYAGAGRTFDPPPPAATAGVRVLPVHEGAPNCGLRRIGVQRSSADPDTWEILVAVRNYGSAPHPATVALAFSGSPAGSRRVVLAPLTEENLAFQYRTRAAGVLEARLFSADAFPEDDRASLELPGQKPLNVTVYSDDPEPLRPMLAANPLVTAVFRATSAYRPGAAGTDVAIFDRFNPPARPACDAIWIEPPAQGGPVMQRTTVSDAVLTSWSSEHALAAGLRAKDLRLGSAEVFAPAPGDVAVAAVEAGPVIVAHQEKPKFVALGFHPARGALRYELTTPLLFANILRWMAPDIFRRWELYAASPGTVSVELNADEQAGGIRVLSADGTELPYTVDGRSLRFFAATPGTVRVLAGDREMVYSFPLPEVADARWTPPAASRRGLPAPEAGQTAAFFELWPWLALAGGLGLALEWLWFGRGRMRLNWLRPWRSLRSAS
ncbi:MAG TPA: VWA domain-containing protein [Bryobacteraceae bacterium]|nr:VWA domain-containing protein [Bryobacteraceae bacterium]